MRRLLGAAALTLVAATAHAEMSSEERQLSLLMSTVDGALSSAVSGRQAETTAMQAFFRVQDARIKALEADLDKAKKEIEELKAPKPTAEEAPK
jgi:hypothetical protein